MHDSGSYSSNAERKAEKLAQTIRLGARCEMWAQEREMTHDCIKSLETVILNIFDLQN